MAERRARENATDENGRMWLVNYPREKFGKRKRGAYTDLAHRSLCSAKSAHRPL